ncbi:MAG TPA: carboxymuconolactone decarboxylase family protein [Thermoleophilaceae bacterium]|jgi:uncharacterized peroxidase-related enzyme|nr:carboxymuconolactone decarboxylase family protein [Thermoleophilaceae bacterium]
MTYIETVPEAEATGAVAEMYAGDREQFGQLRNLTQALSLAPEIAAAWMQLNAAIKARMELRRYELATIAAARRLRSTYCAHAHGSVLLEQFIDEEALRAVMADHHEAGLDPVDVAIMDYAEKIVDDASCVTEMDIERLRAHGLSDSEILDVAAAAAARCFFSKLLDALGVQADATYRELEPELSAALTVGRPVDGG